MAHVRQQIRDAIVTALTGLTTTGTNVFRSRIYPLENNTSCRVFAFLHGQKPWILIH